MNAGYANLMLSAPDCEPDQVADLQYRLMAELQEAGLEVETETTDGVLPGAKAGELLALGSILVTVAPGVLPKVVEVVGGWLNRQPRTVEHLKITAGAVQVDIPNTVTPEQLSRYIEVLTQPSRGPDA